MDIPSLHIDPNPVFQGDVFKIRFYNALRLVFTIEVIDAQKNVLLLDYTSNKSVILMEFPTDHIAKGSYQVRIQNGKLGTSRQLIVS